MRVVFNADDYGAHPRISRGIREAIAAGVVRSTSVLANCVSEEELAALKELSGKGLSVGVHLNLTRGKPLMEFPQELLLPDGSFDRAVMWSPVGVPLLPNDLLTREMEAQMEVVAPLAPTHLDGHHHIHAFWNTFEVTCRFARKHGLAVRALNGEMREELSTRGVRHTDYFVSGFFGKNNLSVENLISHLKAAQAAGAATVEVMCHPGHWEGLPEESSSYREERETELSILTSDELAAALTEDGIEVVSYYEV